MRTVNVALQLRTSPGVLASSTAIALAPQTNPNRSDEFTPAYWQRLQKLSGKPLAYTPAVKHLPDGKQALAERLQLIGSARSSIVLATYSIQYGPEVVQILDALIAKAKDGVAVAFKFDEEREYALGGSEDIVAIKGKFRELEAAGGVVFGYGLRQQMKSIGSGDHMKALVIDGKDAIAGGRNFGVKHFNGTYGDYDVRVSGSAAPEYSEEIIRTLQRSILYHGDLTTGSSEAQRQRATQTIMRLQFDARSADKKARAQEQAAAARGESPGVAMQIVVCDPAMTRRDTPKGEQENVITQAFIETIDRAHDEIILNCNYFNPGQPTIDAIVRAAKRGVQVHIVTASREGAGISELPYLNARRIYPQLLAAGVHIWESQRYQHEKLFVVDRKVATVGSYNFEPAAEEKLKEQTTFSADPTWVRTIRNFLCETIRNETKPFDPTPAKLTWWQIVFYPFWALFNWIKESLAYAMRTQF